MKKIFSILLIALLLGTTVSCNQKNATKSSELADSAAIALGNLYGNGVGSQLAMDSTFKDKAAFLRGLENTLNLDTDKTEYINGVQLGMNLQNMLRNLNEQGVQIDKAKFLKAFKAAFMNDSVLDQANLMTLQNEVSSIMDRVLKEAKKNDPKLQANLKAGADFIKAQTKKEKYLKTPAGVYYQVITEGQGDNFKTSDVINVKYKGMHIDGTVFDESGDNVVPMSTQAVVLGFQDMLLQMKPGMKVKCIIPADLAYGEEGREPKIEPGETLIFELETIGIQEKKAEGAK